MTNKNYHRRKNGTTGLSTAATVALVACAATRRTAGSTTPFTTASPHHHTTKNDILCRSIRGGGGTSEMSSNSTQSASVTAQYQNAIPDDEEKECETTKQKKMEINAKKKSRRKKKKTKKDDSTATSAKQSAEPEPQKKKDPAIIETILGEENYYSILGIEGTASREEITKAYRRRAVHTHPDKVPSGDRRAFDKVSEAYDVLSDEGKKRIYDRFGKRGLQDSSGNGAAGNPNPFFRFGGNKRGASVQEEILRSFFGASSSASNARREQLRPRNRNVRYQLEVTLEDLYEGATRTILLSSHNNNKKSVQVSIERGMNTGQTIVCHGEIDSIPNAAPADLVFILSQRPHSVFTRRSHDLAMEVQLTLKESICGFKRMVKHLDGRHVVLLPPRRSEGGGSVFIKDGDVHVLRGEGMPKPRGLKHVHDEDGMSGYGDLYVQYRVKMPTLSDKPFIGQLTKEERDQLGVLLDKLEGTTTTTTTTIPRNNHNEDTPDDNVRFLEMASSSDFGRRSNDDEHVDGDDGEEYLHQDDQFPGFGGRGSPFGTPGGFGFFSSGGMGGGGNTFRQYQQQHQDEGDVQCQQM